MLNCLVVIYISTDDESEVVFEKVVSIDKSDSVMNCFQTITKKEDFSVALKQTNTIEKQAYLFVSSKKNSIEKCQAT